MEFEPSADLKALIDTTRAHPTADFYRAHWGSARDFGDLPPISREDFLKTPLGRRRYKNERSLVKVVRSESGPFLCEWAFSDIAKEAWGLPSKRPMVYLNESDEAVEKSMWCYEHNMVPLIGEQDADIAMYTAGRYDIDSLITGPSSLPLLLAYLEKRKEPLSSITLIGDSFTEQTLSLPLMRFAKRVRLVLALPETGGFAEAAFGERPDFTLLPHCYIEEGSGLLLTKTARLVTPVIRFRLPLHVFPREFSPRA